MDTTGDERAALKETIAKVARLSKELTDESARLVALAALVLDEKKGPLPAEPEEEVDLRTYSMEERAARFWMQLRTKLPSPFSRRHVMDQTGWPRTTVERYLRVGVREGYIEKTAHGEYDYPTKGA